MLKSTKVGNLIGRQSEYNIIINGSIIYSVLAGIIKHKIQTFSVGDELQPYLPSESGGAIATSIMNNFISES